MVSHITLNSPLKPAYPPLTLRPLGDGSSAYGGVYRDVVTLANITVHNATVESAISVSNSLIQDPYMDGIFGLAYRLPVQTSPKQPTVLSSLLPLLNEPLFTVDLRWRSPDGVYTFGYIDHERHSGHIKYTSLLPGAQFWELEYTGIHVEGQDRWYKSTQIPWRAIVDTGTTLILTPQDVSDLYFSDVPNAMFNESIGGVWTYPCNVSLYLYPVHAIEVQHLLTLAANIRTRSCLISRSASTVGSSPGFLENT